MRFYIKNVKTGWFIIKKIQGVQYKITKRAQQQLKPDKQSSISTFLIPVQTFQNLTNSYMAITLVLVCALFTNQGLFTSHS